MEPNRRMPDLSPSAVASTSPRAMPTSSTVWWASTSRSPVADTARSKPAWRPSWLTMWSKKGRPVETSVAPEPSTTSDTSMVVSLVALETLADRTGGSTGAPGPPGPLVGVGAGGGVAAGAGVGVGVEVIAGFR